VRLLTPKVTRTGATVAKSKGCAFLEFSAKPALQAALRLHQSELDGRRINVELTAGGGGRGDSRLAKLKARNKDLAAQRVRQSPRIAQLLPLLTCHFVDATVAEGGYRAGREQGVTGEFAAPTLLDDLRGG
jgi:RNA recognition motif-containing protein